MQYCRVKITPDDIRKKLCKKIEDAEEDGIYLSIPINKKEEFDRQHAYFRMIKKLYNENSLKNNYSSKLTQELSFYRGEFDINVNAYRIESVIPKELFEKGKQEGYIFSVRFKSEMLEDYLDGVFIWYIREDVSN